MQWPRHALVAAALLTALLGGCGGSGSESDDPASGDDDSGSDTEAVGDWWRCDEPRLGGAFTFGRAPFGCPVSEFGDPAAVEDRYAELVFDDSAGRSNERSRYMDAMYPFLRALAEDVITDRKPDVGATEIAEWQHAVFATAQQESFWSHYRRDPDSDTPSFLSMLRGDRGHGHGLLQLDDRFWQEALLNGAGWRIEDHAIFALNILFDGWARAPDQPCVSSADAWRERSRSAYSAYNGGPARICRWADEDDPNHAIDVQFINKYDRRAWRDFVRNPSTASTLSVACLRGGARDCSVDDGATGQTGATLLQTEDGGVCMRAEDGLQCLAELADAACLAARAGIDGEHIASAPARGKTERRMLDRHAVCRDAVAALAGVGDYIELTRETGLARAPDAAPRRTARAGEVVQVLDFRVTDAETGARAYRIARDGAADWIAGGDNRDHADAIRRLPGPSGANGPIPATGERWWVVAPQGIALRATPDGEAVRRVPRGAAVSVLEVTVAGPDNRIHVRSGYGGDNGWLYAGRAGDPGTLGDWLARQPAEVKP